MLFTDKEMLMLKPNNFDGKKVDHIRLRGKNGIIMVGADWCEHCTALKPVWKELRKIAKEHFTVAAVDAVKYPKLTKKLGVSGFPTLFIVDDGKLKPYTEERTLFNLVKTMCKYSKHPRCTI